MFHKKILGIMLLLAVLGNGCRAAALDVDFDYHLFVVEALLGQEGILRGVDGDGNGIWEEAQLGLLGAILAGGDSLESCIDSAAVTEIQAGYPDNLDQVETDLVATVDLGFPYGSRTFHIISDLAETDPDSADALQHLIAGMMTCAEDSTVVYVNSLIDAAIEKLLSGVVSASQVAQVQSQINVSASDYAVFGGAGGAPDYLGASGDIDSDTLTNLAEYESASGAREAWMEACCANPSLRIASITGGGIKLTGDRHAFAITTAGAEGALTYEWRKGTQSSSNVVSNASDYTVDFLNTSNSGAYFCVVSDGVTSRRTPLRSLTVVYVNLFIKRQIQGGTAAVGGSFTFTVEVQGGAPGPYQYTWYHGGEEVGTDSASLTLTGLTLEDAGQYSVSVTSNGGVDATTSGPVTLTVVSPTVLQISQQPQGAVKLLGQSYTFQITALGGSGTYHYDWWKDGASLGAADASTLTIDPIAETDMGTYWCVLSDTSNPPLSVTSEEVLLDVAGARIAITEQPQNAEIALGEPYTFTVMAEGGRGLYNYDWRKNGVSLGAPDQNSLVIESIGTADQGSYSCFVSDASNTSNFALSNVATLMVLLPALVIHEQPEGGSLLAGESFSFSISVSGGSGSYHFNWKKDSVSIGAPDAASYTIDSAQVSDSGVYSCVITDAFRSTLTLPSADAMLTVTSVPPLVIESQPESWGGYIGESYALSVAVSGGSGSYHYEWRKDGAAFGAPDAASYVINPVSMDDAGAYACYITDDEYAELEALTDAVLLDVAEHLSIVTPLAGARHYAGQPMQLEIAVAGGLAPVTFTWYHDGNPVAEAPDAGLWDMGYAEVAETGAYAVEIQDRRESLSSDSVSVLVEAYPIPANGAEFNVTLTGLEVVPSNESLAEGLAPGYILPAKSGGGTLIVSLYHSVLEPVQFALYRGGPGETGEVLADFGEPPASMNAQTELDAETASAVLTGYAYLQVTSSSYPDGEIRAQIFPVVAAPSPSHSADQNEDSAISLSELLRVIQFFNTGGFHCASGTEDGYAPAADAGAQSCLPHSSDYNPQNWAISLSELLRLIQFFNSPGSAYHECADGEDGYCPGLP